MIEEGPKVPGRACSLEGILVLPLDGLILADTTGVIQMDPDLSQNIFLSQARSHGRRDVSMLLLCAPFSSSWRNHIPWNSTHFHAECIPSMCIEMSRGGGLVALHKAANPGSRPVAMGMLGTACGTACCGR